MRWKRSRCRSVMEEEEEKMRGDLSVFLYLEGRYMIQNKPSSEAVELILQNMARLGLISSNLRVDCGGLVTVSEIFLRKLLYKI